MLLRRVCGVDLKNSRHFRQTARKELKGVFRFRSSVYSLADAPPWLGKSSSLSSLILTSVTVSITSTIYSFTNQYIFFRSQHYVRDVPSSADVWHVSSSRSATRCSTERERTVLLELTSLEPMTADQVRNPNRIYIVEKFDAIALLDDRLRNSPKVSATDSS
jgi:hypothetical protein